MKISCPHCRQNLEIDDDLLGIQVTCPTCNKDMMTPSLPPGAATPPRQPRSRPVAPSPTAGDLHPIGVPLVRAGGWIRLLGVLQSIGALAGLVAALLNVSAFGDNLPLVLVLALFAACAIGSGVNLWLGILLLSSATALRNHRRTGAESDLVIANRRLAFYFRILGVLSLTGLILGGVFLGWFLLSTARHLS